MTLCYFTSF